MHYPIHPAAGVFPLMAGVAYETFVEDVRLHGQLEPILLTPDGQVLDGRNRLRACRALNLVPRTAVYAGEAEPIELVASLNLHRRHLTASQRAAVAVRFKGLFAVGAKARRLSGLRRSNRPATVAERLGDSRDNAGRACHVSARYVDRAERIGRRSPDTFAALLAGSVTIRQAEQLMRPTRPVAPDPRRVVVRLSGRFGPEEFVFAGVTYEQVRVGLERLRDELREDA